ncbi:MAG: phosphatidylserine decarboxylase [Oceanospirillaceae bacterium]|nr:phosphatidylserine decarboxylase [Oceanospirillaceae bacterium]
MKTTLFILFQQIIPQHLLSRLVGSLAECRQPWLKNWLIQRFINHFNVDMGEAQESQPQAYANFNAFFTRALKDGARKVSLDANLITSPADGAISEIGNIDYGRILQAKGRGYSLTSLVGGDEQRAEPFINGRFATIYLSPKDYHRVHMPAGAVLKEAVYVPGDLYSVNQTTAENVDALFARNERLVCIFETEQGPMAMILVGAMIVAGIETVWAGQVAPPTKQPQQIYNTQADTPILLEQGAEMGRFKLGSTVILLFPDETIEWLDSLKAGTPLRMGEVIGERIKLVDAETTEE